MVPLLCYALEEDLLLSYDVEIAFCAGAWLSVIVLAYAVIDATIRDTESGDYEGSTKNYSGKTKTFNGFGDYEIK